MTEPSIVIDDLSAEPPPPARPAGGRSLLAGILVGLLLGWSLASFARGGDEPVASSADPPAVSVTPAPEAASDTPGRATLPASTDTRAEAAEPGGAAGPGGAVAAPVHLAAIVRTTDGRSMVRWSAGRTTPVIFSADVDGAVSFDASGRWLLSVDGPIVVVGDGRVLGPISTQGAGAAWHPTRPGSLAWGEAVGDLRTSRTVLRLATIVAGRFQEPTDLDLGRQPPAGSRLLAWNEEAAVLAAPDGITAIPRDGSTRRFTSDVRVVVADTRLVIQDARGVRVSRDLARPDLLAFDAALDAPVVAAATSPQGRTALLVAPLSDGLDPDRRAVYVFAPNGDVVAQVGLPDASTLAWSGETLWVGYTAEDGTAHLLPVQPSGVGRDLALGVDGRVEAIGVAREPHGATR